MQVLNQRNSVGSADRRDNPRAVLGHKLEEIEDIEKVLSGIIKRRSDSALRRYIEQ